MSSILLSVMNNYLFITLSLRRQFIIMLSEFAWIFKFTTPSLWEAALETEWRCFSKVILESNVTPNIIRLSDSFSTVPPIVNGGEWGWIMHDLETIKVLVLLAFNFIPQRSHHSLTLPRSRIKDSATVTLTPRFGTTAIEVESSDNRSAYFPQWKKAPECTGGTIRSPKHCPAALLIQRQPVYFDNHPP